MKQNQTVNIPHKKRKSFLFKNPSNNKSNTNDINNNSDNNNNNNNNNKITRLFITQRDE